MKTLKKLVAFIGRYIDADIAGDVLIGCVMIAVHWHTGNIIEAIIEAVRTAFVVGVNIHKKIKNEQAVTTQKKQDEL